MPKFTVRSSDKTFKVDILGNGGRITVDGVDHRVDFIRLSSHTYSLILNGHSFYFYLQPDGGSVKAIHGGREYALFVEDQHSLLLRSLQRTTTVEKAVAEVRAPMPGMVTKVEVRKGIRVEQGGGLLILEAMKMENEIRAPARGIVTEILAETGKSVERGEVLVRITT
jgi:biotin carboxyl carrier protein